jgi:uncharacterized protein YydD (DUF2326 family)
LRTTIDIGGKFSKIGFRELLAPLIRDERSEFKSITSTFDTKSRAPDNYAPHLMFPSIDLDIYRSIKATIKEIDKIAAEEKRIKESVELVRQKPFNDARSDLNILSGEVEKIEKSIDNLENAPAFDVIKDDILLLEDKIGSLRREKEVLKQRLSRLKPITLDLNVDTDDVSEFYNQLKAGLGELISRDLEQVIDFKERIDNFQNYLLSEKSSALEYKLKEVNRRIRENDKNYKKLTEVLDQNGQLKSLRQTYSAFQAKNDELVQLKSFFDRHRDLLSDRQQKKSDLEAEKLSLNSSILGAAERVNYFEKTILDVHQFIQGNRNASFNIETTSKKQVVEISLRIDDDGSHSVEREKVFIYDFSLLLNDFTKYRHPGFLIHDNIFDVDNDTLEKSLEYILTRAPLEDDQQYILTLNMDRIEHCEGEVWYEELRQNTVASFTKNRRFLKNHYQEK